MEPRSVRKPFGRPLTVIVMFLGAQMAGFTLVILFHEPRKPTTKDVPATPRTSIATEKTAPANGSGQARNTAGFVDAEAPAEVPPGRTPFGVTMSGTPLYLRCWNEDGGHETGSGCGPLKILERRLASRLYVIDRCKRRLAGENEEGRLSLGINVAFEDNRVGFWSGPSSDIENAKQIGSCVRRALAGFPLYEIDHTFDYYRLFVTVNFKDPAILKRELAKAKKTGRSVEVVKDHVRVRESPVDGTVLGKVSSDRQVTLVRRRNAWCRVITPDDRQGWMICDALAL